MIPEEHRSRIERFIAAYNAFDIDGMMAQLHPDCRFTSVSKGQTNAAAAGRVEFRALAERSAKLFSSRRQVVDGMYEEGDTVRVDVDYEAVAAVDISPEIPAGEALRLQGWSIYEFRDGLISRLTDFS
jgi:ketosteroid isomerase-like protein